MVVEFALLTALCLAPLGELRRVVVYVFAAAGVALVPGAVLIVTDARARIDFVWRTGMLDRHDVKEYQPAGYKLAGSRYADLGLEQLKDTPADLLHAGRRDVQGRQRALWRDAPSRSTARSPTTRHAAPLLLPGLAARCQACRSLASEPLRAGLLHRPAPAETVTRLDRAALPIERWGQAISGVSLLLLLRAGHTQYCSRMKRSMRMSMRSGR